MKPKVWLMREFEPDIMARLQEAADVVISDMDLLPGAEAISVGSADGELMDRAGPQLKQIAFPGIGVDGQAQIRKSHVALIGVGGLGCAAAQYLVSSGIGELFRSFVYTHIHYVFL